MTDDGSHLLGYSEPTTTVILAYKFHFTLTQNLGSGISNQKLEIIKYKFSPTPTMSPPFKGENKRGGFSPQDEKWEAVVTTASVFYDKSLKKNNFC